AIRDRLIIAMLVLIGLSASLSVFMASAAVTEQDQFTAVFSAGSLRILGVLGLVLFVVFFMRRSFEARDIEFLLSRPISRVQFILSYTTGFSCLAVIIGAACGICVVALSPHLVSAGTLLWCLSIIVENIIMVNMALFFAMFISSAAMGVLAVLAFYVLARMMGQILGIIDAGTSGLDFQGLEIAVQAISVITPRLDLLGQTSWLIYGAEDAANFGFVIAQGAVFIMLVLSAALLDLMKRQF
ncbi:MAG: hypothetical protein ACPGRX_06020, partial [Bdellovibrionales bacterium]